MSTRAIYTFSDDHETIHVYKHFDGYPEGGVQHIAAARAYAWPLPRFEADEFAAAFVTANKGSNGDIRLTAKTEPQYIAPDAEFRYHVTLKENMLWVEIYETSYWHRKEEKLVFSGTLEDALTQYTKKG